MKRLIFCAGMMLVTFAVGIGIHRLIAQRQVDKAPPPPKVEVVSLAPVELRRESPPPAPPEPAATPKPIFVLDYDRKKFAPWAVFYVMGQKPRAFADFESLEVALSEHGDPDDGYIGVNTIGPDSAWDGARATFALVTERRLFFVTSQLRDQEFEYRFDGKFLRTDFMAVDGKKIAVIRGTLTKTRNGRQIAEHTFDFRMEYLGC